MSKICLITDTHFGARSDSIQFDNFFRKFYEETFWPTIDKHNIKTIIHLGDCFDRRKYINFSTLKSCREYFFDQAKKRNVDVTMIVGNHDTFFKNTNDVNSPDLLLRDYDNITIIKDPKEVFLYGQTFLLMPWVCTDNYNDCMTSMKNTRAPALLGHFEIAGFQMYKGHDNNEGFDSKIFSQFDIVCSGHFHHRSSKDNIYYLGNPYEITWSDYDDPRGFHILDPSNLSLEFIENPNVIFKKVYYDDTKDLVDPETLSNQHIKLIVVNKTDFYKFDQYIDRIHQADPLELKIIEDLSEFESEALDDKDIDLEDTVTLLSQYVDSLDTDADKDRIKTVMKTLYVEAQAFEE